MSTTIGFVPVCNNCHSVLDKINIYDFERHIIYEDNIYLGGEGNTIIYPFTCPYCNEEITNVYLPQVNENKSSILDYNIEDFLKEDDNATD